MDKMAMNAVDVDDGVGVPQYGAKLDRHFLSNISVGHDGELIGVDHLHHLIL